MASTRVRGGSWLGGTLHVAVGGAAFLLTAQILRGGFPGPRDFEVTAKLAYFEEHAADFDALFIGSSVVQHHLVPAVVDARLAERGLELTSFNLGGSAMTGFECDHVLRRVLGAPAPYYNHGALRRQIAAIRRSGAEPIYVVPPSTLAADMVLSVREEFPALFFFDVPDRYPGFFSFESHLRSRRRARAAVGRDGLPALHLLPVLSAGPARSLAPARGRA